MPKNSTKDYAIALYTATKGVSGEDLGGVINNFLRVLFRDRKLKQVGRILKDFEQYSKKQEGIVTIEVTSARELDEKTLTAVKKVFGEKVEATTKVNPDLIGGVTVREESTIFDASLKTQLQRLKQQLS